MKATEKDIKEWWGVTMGSDKFTTSGYRINALISFHNWMLNKQDRQPKPEPKINKPKYYNHYRTCGIDNLMGYIEAYKHSIEHHILNEEVLKNLIKAAEYTIAEQTNEIKIGDRYNRIMVDRVYEVIGIYRDDVWLIDENGQYADYSKNQINDTHYYTKLPKDENKA